MRHLIALLAVLSVCACKPAGPGKLGSYTPTTYVAAHAPQHKAAGADSIKLDELAAGTDVTTLNASTATHGLAPKLRVAGPMLQLLGSVATGTAANQTINTGAYGIVGGTSNTNLTLTVTVPAETVLLCYAVPSALVATSAAILVGYQLDGAAFVPMIDHTAIGGTYTTVGSCYPLALTAAQHTISIGMATGQTITNYFNTRGTQAVFFILG